MTATLETRVERLEAARAVSRLFARYQYLAAVGNTAALEPMFSTRADVSAELADWGVFVGPNRVRQIVLGPISMPDGPPPGHLNECAIMTPVVEVAQDAKTVEAVWMGLIAGAGRMPGAAQAEAGWTWVHFHVGFALEEDGEWRITKFVVAPRWRTPFDRSWAKTAALGPMKPPPGMVPPSDLPPTHEHPSDYTLDRPTLYDRPIPDPVLAPGLGVDHSEERDADAAELVRRVTALEDRLAIENLMSRHEYLHAGNENTLEFETCFSTRLDTSFEPEDWGVWEGPAQIQACYVDGAPPALPGLLTEHASTTSLIEVAADGQTAQGVWISPGHETFPSPDGTLALWSWGRYGIDFVKEDGVWKFWHFHIYTTFRTPFETSWVDNALNPAPGTVTPEGDTPPGMPAPTRGTTVNLPYHPSRAPQLEPVLPEPYATFDPARSYTAARE